MLDVLFANLSASARPPTRDGVPMRRFASFFASYLETSFELDADPGTRLESPCGCYCSYCAVAAAAPHLRTKRIGRPEKRRARELQRECLRGLARSRDLSLDDDTLAALLEGRTTRRRAALVAYAHQLFRRCGGAHTGPWVLALWRTFAWRETGSPDPDFELTPEVVLDAERALLETLSSTGA